MTDRTLLDSTVLVSRATVEIAVQRLALAAAHGTRQRALVEEWIELGEVTGIKKETPGTWVPRPGRTGVHPQEHVFYGRADLPYKSWRNLTKRLRATGFLITGGPLGPVQIRWRV